MNGGLSHTTNIVYKSIGSEVYWFCPGRKICSSYYIYGVVVDENHELYVEDIKDGWRKLWPHEREVMHELMKYFEA